MSNNPNKFVEGFVRWYERLVSQSDGGVGLLDREIYEEKSLIIAREYAKLSYQYAKFKPISRFLTYLKDDNQVNSYEQLCFYEVIPRDLPMKIFFDLDIERTIYMNDNDIIDESLKGKKIKLNKKFSLNGEEGFEVSNILIECLMKLLPMIKFTDVLKLNSSGKDKISYHIIVDRWYNNTIEDMRALCEEVCKIFPEKYLPAIDRGIYTKNRLFRTFGSHKFGSTELSREKKLDPSNTWRTNEKPIDETHEWCQIFMASLITNSSYCSLLPSFHIEKPKSMYTGDEIILNENEITDALNLFANSFGCDTYNDNLFPFTLTGVTGSRIELKRSISSWCNVCQRNHDTIDQFLTIRGKNREVFQWCFRRSGTSFSIGSLKPEFNIQPTNENTQTINENGTPINNINTNKPKVIELIENGTLKINKLHRTVNRKVETSFEEVEIKDYTSSEPLKRFEGLEFIEKKKEKTVREIAKTEIGMGNFCSKVGKIVVPSIKLENKKLKTKMMSKAEKITNKFKGEKFI